MMSSPALAPSLDGPSPSQRQFLPVDSKKYSSSAYYSTTSVLLLVVASLACIQSYRYFGTARGYGSEGLQEGLDAGVYAPSDARFLGRNWKQRMLEQQLYEKDQEVKYLRKQLDAALATARVKDETMSASDSLIRTLQDRTDSEKHARSKAQLALAEKVSALQTCVRQRDTLQAEVERCSQSLVVVAGGRAF